MATNHWRIIIDNFPKYFSERVQFLYGCQSAFRAVSHMRGIWEHQMAVDTEVIPQLHLHGYVESDFYITTQAAAKLKLHGSAESEYQVNMDTIPRLKLYGKFPNEFRVAMDVDISTIIYGRHNFIYHVDVDIQPKLHLRGNLEHEMQYDMEISSPVTNMNGRCELKYAVDFLSDGFLEIFGRMPSESIVQMNAAAFVATYYKLFERNDETLETVNNLSLENFCIKTIN